VNTSFLEDHNHLPEACELEDEMARMFKKNTTEMYKALLSPMQSTPFANAFYLSSEATGHSESKSSELTNTWEEHENKKRNDNDEDLELHRLMEDIKRYIRSIDISDL